MTDGLRSGSVREARAALGSSQAAPRPNGGGQNRAGAGAHGYGDGSAFGGAVHGTFGGGASGRCIGMSESATTADGVSMLRLEWATGGGVGCGSQTDQAAGFRGEAPRSCRPKRPVWSCQERTRRADSVSLSFMRSDGDVSAYGQLCDARNHHTLISRQEPGTADSLRIGCMRGSQEHREVEHVLDRRRNLRRRVEQEGVNTAGRHRFMSWKRNESNDLD